jgi:hypothetical protein
MEFTSLRLHVKPSAVCLLVLLLALLIRGGLLLMTPGALLDDTDGYRRLAANLVEQGTFGAGDRPTAFRPPLYPLLLSGCVAFGDYSRVAIGSLHVVLGVATVWLTLVLGRRLGLGIYGAALAAMLVACDPILLSQSTVVMTETPAAFFAVAGLAALAWIGASSIKPRPAVAPSGATTGRGLMLAMLASGVLGLGALCRPTLLLWTVAVGGVLLINSRELTAPGKAFASLRLPLAFFLGVAIVLSPWAIRNQVQFGRPIVTTTHGGFTLLLANNPEFYQWLREGQWGSVWQSERFNADWDRRKPSDELAADRLAYSEAKQNISREPGTFCYACLVRLGRFWSPLPHQVMRDETLSRRLSRYAVAAWYVAEFLLAASGLWYIYNRKQSDEKRKAENGNAVIHHSSLIIHNSLLLVLCLSAAHTVYWTDMRMRAPLMPVVAIAAAAGVLGLLHAHFGRAANGDNAKNSPINTRPVAI